MPRNQQQNQKNKKSQTQKIQFNQLQDYVGFQMQLEQFEPEPIRKKQSQMTQQQIQHRQKMYIKSKFQFVVLQQPQKEVRWDEVYQVIYATTHEITCPICMNDTFEITTPYITPCGHIYCLPCYQRHYAQSKFNQKCPLCGELAVISDLKSVKIIRQQHKNAGEIIRLNQIVKIKNQPELYVNGSESIIYARTLVVNFAYVMKIIEEEIQQLSNYLEYCDNELQDPVNKAIQFLLGKQDKLPKIGDKGQPQIYLKNIPEKYDSLYRFYQDSTGIIGFLHPLCNKFLQQQFGIDHMPSEIQSFLIQSDKFTQNDHTQSRYKFMSHIPLHTEIFFYEIDIKNYLDEENYKKFDYEMKDFRLRQKKEKIKQEEKYNYIQEKQEQKKVEQVENTAGYFYVNKFSEDFQDNEQDFPGLPKVIQQIDQSQQQEEEEQTQLKNELKEKQQQQQQQQQQQKQGKQEIILDEQDFPVLSEESTKVWISPYAESWGKQKKEEKNENEEQLIEIPQKSAKIDQSELDFQIIVKQKKKRKGKTANS